MQYNITVGISIENFQVRINTLDRKGVCEYLSFFISWFRFTSTYNQVIRILSITASLSDFPKLKFTFLRVRLRAKRSRMFLWRPKLKSLCLFSNLFWQRTYILYLRKPLLRRWNDQVSRAHTTRTNKPQYEITTARCAKQVGSSNNCTSVLGLTLF